MTFAFQESLHPSTELIKNQPISKKINFIPTSNNKKAADQSTAFLKND